LATLGKERDLWIGAAVNRRAFASEEESRYREILQREFSMVTAENVMKFRPLVPEPGQYDFKQADDLVEFAREHGMKVRGHTLVWHRQYPNWLTEEEYSPEQIREILRRHIFTVAGRYRGAIRSWDVVNEAVEDDGSMRDSIWLRSLGKDYIAQAFRWAHEADPAALLFYNDYSGEGLGPKSDAIYELVKNLLENGVPIHGVGLQMHLVLDSHPPLADMQKNIQRLNDLGLEVSIAEMDIRIRKPVTPEKLERQAQLYADVMRLALQADNVREFVLWGFTDRYSWIPNWFPETDEGLIFDRDYEPKPAFHALREALRDRRN